ncbi:MAG: D-alanyl-D-alanine carboxypeptidase family protein [Ruminococcaceae bacterium]|nr:D-alanyl-D-alanine carboxypeptidase family protein [Oscillospiraceae bacterium]
MHNYNDYNYGQPKRQNNTVMILLIVLISLVLIVAVMGIVYMVKNPVVTPPVQGDTTPAVTDGNTDEPADTTNPVTTEPPVTEPVPDERGITFVGEKMESKLIHTGDLVLVNKDYAYDFEVNAKKDGGIGDLYSFWKPWPKYSYKLTGTKVKMPTRTAELMSVMFDAFLDETGENDYLITSGYRDYQLQQETLDEMIVDYGSESAALRYCALPGHSEHHTGLAFDCYVFTDENKTYKLGEEKMPELYNWIYDNCARFGFIHRYQAGKESITGFAAESWHFRYVGIPHAELIEEKNFCYEEYVNFLRDYSYENYLVYEASNGKTYGIYFAEVEPETVVIEEVRDENGNIITPASVSEQLPDIASIPVPTGNVPYEISGNNVDGFIITISLD